MEKGKNLPELYKYEVVLVMIAGILFLLLGREATSSISTPNIGSSPFKHSVLI